MNYLNKIKVLCDGQYSQRNWVIWIYGTHNFPQDNFPFIKLWVQAAELGMLQWDGFPMRVAVTATFIGAQVGFSDRLDEALKPPRF